MDLKRLSKEFYTADQLQPSDIKALKERGMRSIVNNRPDGETPDQPCGSDVERAAISLGLEYTAVPVLSKIVTAAELQSFKTAIERLPKPVCGFCRTGTRAMICWALSETNRQCTYSIIESVVGAGFPSVDIESQLTATSQKGNNHDN